MTRLPAVVPCSGLCIPPVVSCGRMCCGCKARLRDQVGLQSAPAYS